MEEQPTKLDKAVKISIMLGVLVMALSVAYYLVIFLPKKEKNRLEQEKQEQFNKEQREKSEKEALEEQGKKNKLDLSACLLKAEMDYIEYAKLNGTENKDGTIRAANDVWDRAEKNRKEAKDNCFRKYPQN